MPLEAVTAATLDTLFDTGVKATLWGMQAVMPHFRAQGYGRIVNMGSVIGMRGRRATGPTPRRRRRSGGSPEPPLSSGRRTASWSTACARHRPGTGRPPTTPPGSPTTPPPTATTRWAAMVMPSTTSGRSCCFLVSPEQPVPHRRDAARRWWRLPARMSVACARARHRHLGPGRRRTLSRPAFVEARRPHVRRRRRWSPTPTRLAHGLRGLGLRAGDTVADRARQPRRVHGRLPRGDRVGAVPHARQLPPDPRRDRLRARQQRQPPRDHRVALRRPRRRAPAPTCRSAGYSVDPAAGFDDIGAISAGPAGVADRRRAARRRDGVHLGHDGPSQGVRRELGQGRRARRRSTCSPTSPSADVARASARTSSAARCTTAARSSLPRSRCTSATRWS